jgi:transcription initiation factor TFIID subunit 12
MQAAARAAAGLPPLKELTATSVTTVPRPIPSPIAKGPPLRQPMPQPQPLRVQPVSRQPSISAAQRSTSGASATSRTPPKTAKPAAPQARPTKQPTAHEGRLSLTATKANATGAAHLAPLVGQRIQELVKSIDPNYRIDTEAEEQVLQLADDFLDKVTRQSLMLAKHRGSKTLDVQDIQIVLAKHWGITVPGLGLPNIRPLKPGKQTVPKTPSSAGGMAGSQSNKRKGSDASGSASGASRKKSNAGAQSIPQAPSMQAAT